MELLTLIINTDIKFPWHRTAISHIRSYIPSALHQMNEYPSWMYVEHVDRAIALPNDLHDKDINNLPEMRISTVRSKKNIPLVGCRQPIYPSPPTASPLNFSDCPGCRTNMLKLPHGLCDTAYVKFPDTCVAWSNVLTLQVLKATFYYTLKL